MAFYLQIDGVDDKIVAPSPSGTKYIQMKVKRRADTSGYLFDFRSTSGTTYTYFSASTATAGYDQFIVDGITKTRANTNVSSDLQQDVLHDVTIRLTTATTAESNMTMGTRYTGATIGTDWLAFDLYELKFLDSSSSTLRSFSFPGSGSVLTGSDGNSATLTGGTWVDDGTGGTGTDGSTAFDIRPSIYSDSAVNIDTKQSLYADSSFKADTKQAIYSDSASGQDTKLSFYQDGSTLYDTLQEIFSDGIVGSTPFDLRLVLYADSFVNSDMALRTYTDGTVDFDTLQSLLEEWAEYNEVIRVVLNITRKQTSDISITRSRTASLEIIQHMQSELKL